MGVSLSARTLNTRESAESQVSLCQTEASLSGSAARRRYGRRESRRRRIDNEDGNVCLIDSSAIDDDGNIVMEAGAEHEAVVYTCQRAA